MNSSLSVSNIPSTKLRAVNWTFFTKRSSNNKIGDETLYMPAEMTTTQLESTLIKKVVVRIFFKPSTIITTLYPSA